MHQPGKILEERVKNYPKAKMLGFLIFALIVESFIAKSLLTTFVDQHLSAIVHYGLSAILMGLIAVWPFHVRMEVKSNHLISILKILLILFCLWGLFASFLQTSKILNVIATIMLCLLVYTLYFKIPRFVVIKFSLPEMFGKLTSLLILFLWGSIFLLLAFPSLAFITDGRFNGIYESAAVACFGFSITIYFLQNRLIAERNFKYINVLHLLAAWICLFLIRSRGAIFFAFLVTFMQLGLYLKQKKRSRKIFSGYYAVICIFLLVLTYGTLFGENVIENTLKFTRLTTLKEYAIEDRYNHLKAGLAIFNENVFFGKGLMSKYTTDGQATSLPYGKAASLQRFLSLKYYTMRDPHNAFVYLGQVAGFPFALIFLCFLLTVCRIILTKNFRNIISESPEAGLLATLFIISIIGMPFGGSIVSFGNLGDRFWWLFTGVITCLFLYRNNIEPLRE